MNEAVLSSIINKSSLLLNYLYKAKLPMKKAYSLYHHIIIKILSDDLHQAEEEMSNVKLSKGYVSNRVWVMWWQGLDNAPQIVHNNIARLYSIFGRTSVIVITQKNFRKYTNIQSFLYNKLLDKKISYALWSDIVRYNLLFNNGGLWIDSTVIVSSNVKERLRKLKRNDFISLCNKKEDYRYISNNKWSGWFIGGKRNYELFRFIVSFFNVYFRNHYEQIDYFLVEDAVYFFYIRNHSFRQVINKQTYDWEPYLFADNYKSNNLSELLHLFNTDMRYSIQKFSYKIEYNSDKNSLFSLLNFQKKGGRIDKKLKL